LPEEFMEEHTKIKSWNDAALIDQFRKDLNRKFMDLETFVHKPMHKTPDATVKEAIACDALAIFFLTQTGKVKGGPLKIQKFQNFRPFCLSPP
jgi:hypothetical protein